MFKMALFLGSLASLIHHDIHCRHPVETFHQKKKKNTNSVLLT